MCSQKEKQLGFTLVELLIAMSLVAIILVLALLAFKGQIDRAVDSRRKSDLARIKVALEDYYNDSGCYISDNPTGSNVLVNCGGNQMDPYLKTIPCDPRLKTPYKYVPVSNDGCGGYRLCAKLDDQTDPDIRTQGCHPKNGCGWGVGYNYCVTSGVSVTNQGGGGSPSLPAGTPTAGATPTPAGGAQPTATPTPAGGGGGSYDGVLACQPGTKIGPIVIMPGQCNTYCAAGDPNCTQILQAAGCPTSYSGSCANGCWDSSTWCSY